MFNTAEIMRGKYSDNTGPDEVVIDLEGAGIDLPNDYATTEPSEDMPLYKLVYRPQFGYHLAPVDKPEGHLGPMHNGNYAKVDHFIKKALERKLGHVYTNVLSVHDRFETPAQYAFLSQ
jgi:hypothetical protein